MRILLATLIICTGVALTLIYLDYYINQVGNEPAPDRPLPAQTETANTGPEVNVPPTGGEEPATVASSETAPAVESPQGTGENPVAAVPGNEELERLKSEIESLRRDLEHARGQGEAMEKELVRRNSTIQQFKIEVRKLGEELQKSKQDLAVFKNESLIKEQSLAKKLTDAKDEIVKLQASLDDRSASLSELKERFNLRERQYQTEVASLQKSIQEADTRNKQLFQAFESGKKKVQRLEDKLNTEKEERARQHLDKAREEISLLDARWNDETQTHFENALQQFYFAGKVDPRNGEKYRQMALELVDDQIERLRQRRGKKADADKRMQVFRELRAQIENASSASS